MEASTAVEQRQSVAVQVDEQGNGVQEITGVSPDEVLDPQFEAADAQGSIAVESSDGGHAAIRVTGASPNCAVTVTFSSAGDQSDASTGDSQTHLAELQRLRDDNIISEDEYNAAAAKVNDEGKSTDEAFQEARAESAASQSPGEPQVVPEVRPQAFQTGASHSDSGKRAAERDPGPMDQAAYDRANSDESKKSAADASRSANLVEGQRVVILDPHEEAGRMAFVQSVHYTDGIQDMIARSGSAEARFADVDHYVLRTRDGRSDLLMVNPDELKPIEENQGWGRGQI